MRIETELWLWLVCFQDFTPQKGDSVKRRKKLLSNINFLTSILLSNAQKII